MKSFLVLTLILVLANLGFSQSQLSQFEKKRAPEIDPAKLSSTISLLLPKFGTAEKNVPGAKVFERAPLIRDALKGVTQSKMGGGDAGGGDALVSEFYNIVRLIAVIYEHQYSRTPLGTKSIGIKTRYKTLQIEGTREELYQNGESVEAINYPNDNRIKFNLNDWQKKDMTGKIRLASHEILGLLKISDPRYEVSDAMVVEINTESHGRDSSFDILKLSRPLAMNGVKCRVYRKQSSKREPLS